MRFAIERRSGQQVLDLRGGAAILAVIALPLWDEFRIPGSLGWNIFLAVFLVSLAVGAFFLQRHFWKHPSEIGEARFDTRNDSGD
jgi:hypothetical protein